MPISSRALKEARFNAPVKRRKKKEQEIEDLSVLPNIDPNYYNLGTELPIEEIGDLEPLEQNAPDTQDELITNLEDQILSKIDEESDELAPTPFNNNIADTVPEAVRDKIAAYLFEAIKKDKANRQPWLDVINKAKPYLGFNIEEAQDSNVQDTRKTNPSIGDAAQNKTFDTTFSTSVLRLWATLRSELLPSTGPVGFKTNVSIDETYELKGEMVKIGRAHV